MQRIYSHFKDIKKQLLLHIMHRWSKKVCLENNRGLYYFLFYKWRMCLTGSTHSQMYHHLTKTSCRNGKAWDRQGPWIVLQKLLYEGLKRCKLFRAGRRQTQREMKDCGRTRYSTSETQEGSLVCLNRFSFEQNRKWLKCGNFFPCMSSQGSNITQIQGKIEQVSV